MGENAKKLLLMLVCVVALVLVVFSITALQAQQYAIGIIGGADGPTAVFVTGNPIGLYIATAAALLAATVLFLVFRTRRPRD